MRRPCTDFTFGTSWEGDLEWDEHFWKVESYIRDRLPFQRAFRREPEFIQLHPDVPYLSRRRNQSSIRPLTPPSTLSIEERLSLVRPNFNRPLPDRSELTIEEIRQEILEVELKHLDLMETRSWKRMKTMGQAYLKLRQDQNHAEFDKTWRRERAEVYEGRRNSCAVFPFWQLCDEADDLEMLANLENLEKSWFEKCSNRSGLICFLFEDAKQFSQQLRLVRSLLLQTKEKIREIRAGKIGIGQGHQEQIEVKPKTAHRRTVESPKQKRRRLDQDLAMTVLFSMGLSFESSGLNQTNYFHQLDSHSNSVMDSVELPPRVESFRQIPRRVPSASTQTVLAPASDVQGSKHSLYAPLNPSSQEIRLFKLDYDIESPMIKANLCSTTMDACPTFVAVSYTWGDSMRQKTIEINGNSVKIGENIWNFLHTIRTTKTFQFHFLWIDALCINQGNVHERNHQVKMMKRIYQQAAEVAVWLGKEADNSNVAMDFIANKGMIPLKPKANGYRPIWTEHQGKALLALCERNYWRRIWIVQEVIHARHIIICCGQKSLPWQCLENIYHKLKTIELKGYQRHHRFAAQVLDSVACTILWQRAHWRHPDTPTPTMMQLVQVFKDWRSTDIRDKVNALNGLVVPETSIVIEYNDSVQRVFDAVRNAAPEWEKKDDTLLREVLGIPYPEFQSDKDPPM
ncbi:hypothetical protein IFR05_016482 [Cadophora sp. M221]|nr:hypothetical protein IFR05_016482 [Cadophora sp. M221]